MEDTGQQKTTTSTFQKLFDPSNDCVYYTLTSRPRSPLNALSWLDLEILWRFFNLRRNSPRRVAETLGGFLLPRFVEQSKAGPC